MKQWILTVYLEDNKTLEVELSNKGLSDFISFFQRRKNFFQKLFDVKKDTASFVSDKNQETMVVEKESIIAYKYRRSEEV